MACPGPPRVLGRVLLLGEKWRMSGPSFDVMCQRLLQNWCRADTQHNYNLKNWIHLFFYFYFISYLFIYSFATVGHSYQSIVLRSLPEVAGIRKVYLPCLRKNIEENGTRPSSLPILYSLHFMSITVRLLKIRMKFSVPLSNLTWINSL